MCLRSVAIKAADATVRQSHITSVNKYKGKPNFTAAGQPVDGRSGGGLFSAEGYLIGICNAADPADDEGIYAGLASIHWQLDQIGQAEVYQRTARPLAASTPRNPAAVAASAQASATQATDPQLPAQMPGSTLSDTSTNVSDAPRGPVLSAAIAERLTRRGGRRRHGDRFYRPLKARSAQRSEVYVVDQAPPDLIAPITHAARASGEQRAALARGGPPAAGAGDRPRQWHGCRGQSADY